MPTLHTDIPSRAEIERLLDVRDADDACVSIYVATPPVTPVGGASRIEFKNLAADAIGQVEAAGANHRIVTELREALDELHDDDEFWAQQACSLAVFAAPGRLRTFRLPNRLTDAVELHLQRYFDLHGDQLPPPGLYDRIMREVERPLIQIALDACAGNQLRCAELLGINRNTLRKKVSDLNIEVTRRRRVM